MLKRLEKLQHLIKIFQSGLPDVALKRKSGALENCCGAKKFSFYLVNGAFQAKILFSGGAF